MIAVKQTIALNSPYWERDCQRNFSENSMEFQRCMDNARKHQAPTPAGSSVSMDPDDVNRPDDFELHKSRAG